MRPVSSHRAPLQPLRPTPAQRRGRRRTAAQQAPPVHDPTPGWGAGHRRTAWCIDPCSGRS